MEQVDEMIRCGSCSAAFPVVDGIPRFVPSESYGESFGFQWNRYRNEQLDSRNGTSLSADRFFSETEFAPSWLHDKVVLDAGCGAGRFAEVASRYAGHLVAVDISSAVDATQANLQDRRNVDVVQANLEALPFRPEVFDAIYCIGVLQHTPHPPQTATALPHFLKPRGRLAITAYERKRWTRLNGKYLIRPLTRRMRPRTLERAIRASMPVLFPLTEVLFRIPGFRRVFRFILPIANYVGVHPLGVRQRFQWALLDTFDMLAPAYDNPLTEAELRRALQPDVEAIRRLGNPGLNLVGTRVGKSTDRVSR